jgi:zinc transport system ATP-binding protein
VSTVRSHWISQESGRRQSIVWDHATITFQNKAIVDGVTAALTHQALTALCGSNGAGKTQLIRSALGLNMLSHGSIQVFGKSPGSEVIGYVPQQKSFNRRVNAIVEDVLVAALRGSWPFKISKSERDLAFEKLEWVKAPHLLRQELSSLSGGELQRVFLARAMMHKTRVLILDEPMAAVDVHGRILFMDLLKQLKERRDLTILLITHSEHVVRELADRIMFMDRGSLLGHHEAKSLLLDEEFVKAAFSGHDHEGVVEPHPDEE